MLGWVGAGVGIVISGSGSGFLTKTYTNVFSSFCGWAGIIGAVGVGGVGAYKIDKNYVSLSQSLIWKNKNHC